MLSDRVSAAQGVSPLLALYMTDIGEVDGKVCAIHRGCEAVATIPAEDLGAHEWTGLHDPPPTITTHREHEFSLPASYALTYFEPSRAYENNTQTAIRHCKSDFVQEMAQFQAPIVMGANGARRTAERMLYQTWLQRASFQFALGPKWLSIVAGSPVLVPVGGENNRVRIQQIDMALPGEVRFSALLDADFILDQDATGEDTVSIPLADTPPPVVPGAGPRLDFRVPGNSMYLPGIGI